MSKTLGVVELVTRVGDDRLFFQILDDVATNYAIKRGKRGEANLTEIRFLTDAITPTQVMNGDTKMLGLVVWLPRDLVAQALADSKAAPAADAVDPSADSNTGTLTPRAESSSSSEGTREGKAVKPQDLLNVLSIAFVWLGIAFALAGLALSLIAKSWRA